MSAPRVFSGIQPTADSFHLGNYLGAVRQWVALQESHDAFYCVVDLHAITIPQDPAGLRHRTRVAAAQLFAAGLDPDRCTVFVQSHVPEHTELAWVLSCLTRMGELRRMTQFKDKAAKGGDAQASLGLFSYPVLQAADILLYQTEQVPVGEDQRQHLELSRTLATRFNHTYGPTFTVPQDPASLRQRTRIAAAQLFAAGLDPERCTVFVQSHVPEHTELTWVLGCLTRMGELRRMTQFKDKAAKGGDTQAGLGLFSYPVLQAADILLYQTEQVPVGEDQRQHLELSRTLAIRFNHTYGDTFTVPAAYILRGVEKITDLQDPSAKMSKSSSSPQGIIDVLDEPEAIRRKIARAVTDPGGEVRADDTEKPGITNLLRIYSALSGEPIEAIESQYAGAGYGAFKQDLAEVVIGALAPIRERTEKLLADEAGLDKLLAHGARRARPVARETMTQVTERVGFLPAARAG